MSHESFDSSYATSQVPSQDEEEKEEMEKTMTVDHVNSFNDRLIGDMNDTNCVVNSNQINSKSIVFGASSCNNWYFVLPAVVLILYLSIFYGVMWTMCCILTVSVAFKFTQFFVSSFLKDPPNFIYNEWIFSFFNPHSSHYSCNRVECTNLLLTPALSDHSRIYRECLKCGYTNCEIHDENGVNLLPWKQFLVNQAVDDALEDILNITLTYYIDSWYKDLLSSDTKITHAVNERVVMETKLVIRHLISNLINMVKSHDIVDIIVDDMIKSSLNHYEIYTSGKRSAKSAPFIELSTLTEYARLNQLHPAIKSRDAEVDYLRNVTKFVTPYLLPKKYINSNISESFVRELLSCCILLPTLDIICDPKVINKAMLNFIAEVSVSGDQNPIVEEDGVTRQDETEIKVENHDTRNLLENFEPKVDSKMMSNSSPKHKRSYCNCSTHLGISLREILNDQQMLFLFMNFLKDNSTHNLLQFISSVDSLNMSLMDPELEEEQLKQLYDDSISIFNVYLNHKSVDYINFKDPNIAKEMKNILFGKDHLNDEIHESNGNHCKLLMSTHSSPKDNHRQVVKLRNSEALYVGRDEVYQLLELNYIGLFFESTSYLKLVAGSRCSFPTSVHESPTSSIASSNGFNNNGQPVHKMSHRIHRRQSSLTSIKKGFRDTLWPSPDDGIIPPSHSFGNFNQLYGGRSASSFENIRYHNDSDKVEDAVEVIDESSETKISLKPSKLSLSRSKSINDLSKWKINIPKIETRIDNNLKYFHVYSISVERIDTSTSHGESDEECNGGVEELDRTLTCEISSQLLSEEKQSACDVKKNAKKWIVERRYPEFYELESRLKGFHGDNLITNVDFFKLPNRRTFGDRITVPFLESKREDFEKFLQSVAQSDRLKGSQLVYNFLKSEERTEFTTNILPEINIKNFIKSVPAALTLEKGQNLEQFINDIIHDIKPIKPKPSRPPIDSFNGLEDPVEFSNSLMITETYANNLNTLDECSKHNSRHESFSEQMKAVPTDLTLSLSGVSDYLMFVITKVFSVPATSVLFSVILSIERLFSSPIQTVLNKFINRTISQRLGDVLTSPPVVMKLIKSLKDALYPDGGSILPLAPLTDQDVRSNRKTKEEALQTLTNFIKSSLNGNFVINNTLANSLINDPVDLDNLSFNLFQLFQYPILNKQLMYIWLDQILRRLFPKIHVTPCNGV